MSSLLARAGGKRVLLLNPPIPDTAEASRHDHVRLGTPWGLLRLATWLRGLGADVSLLDALGDPALLGEPRGRVRKRLPCGDDGEGPRGKEIFHYGLDAGPLERRIESLGPVDLIAISSQFTWHRETTHETVAICRRAQPSAKIVLGGLYPTLCPNDAALAGADEVVRGDVAAATFAPTALDLLPGQPMTDCVRLVKGCPFRCGYCVTSTLNDGRVQARQPDELFAEMQEKRRRFGVRGFLFHDDFPVYQQDRHLDPLLDLIAQERLGAELDFFTGFSAQLMTERLAARLRAAGARQVMLALETTSPERSREMNRPQSLDDFLRAVAILRDHGFGPAQLKTFYLIGLPGQTTDEILRATLWMWEHGLTPHFTTYTLTPGSDDMRRYGSLVAGRPLDELGPYLWRFAHPGMKCSELDRIYDWFHERWFPPERIRASRTDDPLIRRMQAILAER